MQTGISNRIILGSALLLCIFFAAVILNFTFSSGADDNSAALSAISLASYEQNKIREQAGVIGALPVRLKIPKINVDASFEYVGLTSKGLVGAPKGPDNAGWFKLSPRPGEVGSSVIDGHAGYRNNRAAVFDNLNKLKVGDKIYVLNEKGETITFVVRKVKVYDRNESAQDVFGSSDGMAHLNLITCTGDWDAKAKTRSSRLVVFSDRIE